MIEDMLEGSLVLEMLANVGLEEDFIDAVDSDNFSKAIALMREADVDEEMIEIVVKKMNETDGSH